MRAWALAAAALLCAAPAAADGGTVRLREDAGPFSITVFTVPEPLTVGPADVSVLVQDRASGAVLLDAAVEIVLRPTADGPARTLLAVPGRNRLLRAAAVEFAAAGEWRLEVLVRRAGASAAVECAVPVGEASGRLAGVWAYLAFPPIAVALFALRGIIRRR